MAKCSATSPGPLRVRETPEALTTAVHESLIGENDPVLASLYADVTFAETLPVFADVFLGPPGRTVWVRRQIGLEDDLAPSVGTDLEAWDLQLFSVSVLLVPASLAAQTSLSIGSGPQPSELVRFVSETHFGGDIVQGGTESGWWGHADDPDR